MRYSPAIQFFILNVIDKLVRDMAVISESDVGSRISVSSDEVREYMSYMHEQGLLKAVILSNTRYVGGDYGDSVFVTGITINAELFLNDVSKELSGNNLAFENVSDALKNNALKEAVKRVFESIFT